MKFDNFLDIEPYSLNKEQKKEFLVILIFHGVATAMEIFKTSDYIWSWKYPDIENSFFVPLWTNPAIPNPSAIKFDKANKEDTTNNVVITKLEIEYEKW